MSKPLSAEKTDPEKGAATQSSEKKRTGRVHPIAIDNLVVHKYAGSAALLKKADKVAREIIAADMRENEHFRVVKPGRYHLHFPKLLPEAGALRASIIANHIFRAIQQFNPTAIQVHDADESALQPPPLTLGTHGDAASKLPSQKVRATQAETDEEAEIRKLASQAMDLMIGSRAPLYEELMESRLGRLLKAEIELKLLPVWNVKSGIISAFECVPVRRSKFAEKIDMAFLSQGIGLDHVKALIDMVVYERVGDELTQKLITQNKALLLCPVHASTLDRTRFISAYMTSGARISATAQKSLVFLVKNIRQPVSRLRVGDLARYLFMRARGLVAEVPLDAEADDLGVFKEFHFHGVRASASAGNIPEDVFLKQVNAFVEKCEKAKLESLVGDLKTNSAAVVALASGCSYLAGSIIAAHSSKYDAIETFELDSLFARPSR